MIYFIQNVDTKAIKIGYSEKNPRKRLLAAQTYNSAELVLLATFRGDTKLELKLQKQFSHYHIRGEWFEPGPDLIDALVTRKPGLEILEDYTAQAQVKEATIEFHLHHNLTANDCTTHHHHHPPRPNYSEPISVNGTLALMMVVTNLLLLLMVLAMSGYCI